jgi:DNA-binding XRE family transcriptional regulator
MKPSQPHPDIRSKEASRENREVFDFVDSSLQTKTFYRQFGQRVRYLREACGLTQEELARQLPLDRGYLSEIENGKRRVSLQIAHRLAQVLNVSLDSLLEVPGDSHD